jgi:hypothetical protein
LEAETDLAFNITEGLGAVAGEEILPEIPIVKWLYGVFKTRRGEDLQPSTALLYGYGFLQLLEIDNSQIGAYGGGAPKFVQNELGKKYIAIIGSAA